MNEFLTWLLDAVQSVDPVLRTVLAGVAMGAVLTGLSTAVSLSHPEVFDKLRFWQAGSIQGRTADAAARRRGPRRPQSPHGVRAVSPKTQAAPAHRDNTRVAPDVRVIRSAVYIHS